MVSSVAENKRFFTDREFERAKQAQKLLHALGTPSSADLKHILKVNGIRNCPVTTTDIALAEKIFGPDIGTLKGKTTRQKPLPVVEDYIEIPPELLRDHQEVILAMDTMKVNGLHFLTTIYTIFLNSPKYHRFMSLNQWPKQLHPSTPPCGWSACDGFSGYPRRMHRRGCRAFAVSHRRSAPAPIRR